MCINIKYLSKSTDNSMIWKRTSEKPGDAVYGFTGQINQIGDSNYFTTMLGDKGWPSSVYSLNKKTKWSTFNGYEFLKAKYAKDLEPTTWIKLKKVKDPFRDPTS